jgi:RNA polymerase sigma factor (sigma-70 family)
MASGTFDGVTGYATVVHEGRGAKYHPSHRIAEMTDGALPPLASRATREGFFLSQLACIERVISWVCVRRGLRGADADDFRSMVKLRLIQNDYEILERFEHRSTLSTYLSAVINNLYRDYRTQRFGRWRTSAEARRLGRVAVLLESLLYRDGLTFDEAVGVLRTDFQVDLGRDAIYELSLKLPPRCRRRARGDSDPEPPEPESGNGLSAVEHAERQAAAHRILLALRRALGRLAAADRIILRLHYEDGLTVADVARVRGESQKALYRRRDALLERLREDLEADGVCLQDVRELFSTLDWESVLSAEVAEGPFLAEAGTLSSPPDGEADPEEGES